MEPHVQDRLVPAERRAVAHDRCVLVVDPDVATGQVGGGEAERIAVDGVLVRTGDDVVVELGVATKRDDAGGDRVSGRAISREAEGLVVVGRDALADGAALRDGEVPALLHLAEGRLERAQHGRAGVEPEETVGLDVRPDPGLPRAALTPVRDERRHGLDGDPGNIGDEASLLRIQAEVEDDDVVEDVGVRPDGPEQVDELIAVAPIGGRGEDRAHHRSFAARRRATPAWNDGRRSQR